MQSGVGLDTGLVIITCHDAEDSRLDTKSMLESLWGGKKMAAHKQIRPIIRRSNKLKQVASPSVKQCLEIYEQPTVHDRYTGKVKTLSNDDPYIIVMYVGAFRYSDPNLQVKCRIQGASIFYHSHFAVLQLL